MAGPLHGIRVIELGGIGPAPYCGMLLADLGAEVVRVERPGAGASLQFNDPHLRNRRSIALNLKAPAAAELVLKLFESADACTEGFRPGVVERLGFGPEAALARNPRLVYGRMTGWGQEGPLAQAAGHDINYIALSGALHAIGVAGGKPAVPLNLIGDFGGGGVFLAFGILAAILSAKTTGKGQVVDAAMIDGAASLMSAYWNYRALGLFDDDGPGTGTLGGGAHYYDVYETKDGRYVSVGALEPPFYQAFVQALGLDEGMFGDAGFAGFGGDADNRPRPELKRIVADAFRTRTRDEWCAIMEGTDICFAPVLGFGEAPGHPHHRARGTYMRVGDHLQNRPAPRFSATPADPPRPKPMPGADTDAVLGELGFDDEAIQALRTAGVIV